MKTNILETIEVVLICDKNYLLPTATTIQSIIEYSDLNRRYNIYVLAVGMGPSDLEELVSHCNNYSNVVLTIIHIAESFVAELFNSETVYSSDYLVASTSALVKFKIPSLLKNMDKCIYLDSDLIVKTDLVELFNVDISDYYAAAVRDIPQVLFENNLINVRENNADYFNSGVMLLNLSLMRDECVEVELVKTKLNSSEDTLMDQNIFNTVFCNRVIQLPLKYNVCYTNLVRGRDRFKYDDINRLYNTQYKCMRDIYNDARIIHYSSPMKPWLVWDSYYADEWRYYYKKSCYGNVPLVRITRGDRITVKKNDIYAEKQSLQERIDTNLDYGQIVPIVFATNSLYAPIASVAIESVIRNSSPERYYDIYILHDEELKLSQKNRLTSIAGNNYSVHCIDVRKGVNELNLYSRAHYSKQMYYRLLIPEILSFYQKVLYLDCDIICNRNISELYDVDLENKLLGAVNNFATVDFDKHVSSLGLNSLEYINSGVLLIDCAKFIAFGIKNKCVRYLQEHGDLLCPDQDAINAVCAGDIYYLPDMWNVQWQHFWGKDYGKGNTLINEYSIRWKDVRYKSYILHFTSGIKPWKNPDRIMANLFWKYARQSDFYEEILYSNIQKKSVDECSILINSSLSGSAFYTSKKTLSGSDDVIASLAQENELLNHSLVEIRASFSYKIGHFITFIPRLIRHCFFGKPM